MKGMRFAVLMAGVWLVVAGWGGLEVKAGPADIREIVALSRVDAARYKRAPGFYEASSWAAWADPCAKTSEELEQYLKRLKVGMVKLRPADETASEDAFQEVAHHLLHANFWVFRGQKSGGEWRFVVMARR